MLLNNEVLDRVLSTLASAPLFILLFIEPDRHPGPKWHAVKADHVQLLAAVRAR